MKKLILIFVLILSVTALISCNDEKQPTVDVTTPNITTLEVTTPDVITPDITTPNNDNLYKGIIFGDVTLKADGTNITLEAYNIPSEVEVVYKYYQITDNGNILLENNYVKEVGNYLVTATFINNQEEVLTLEAKLVLVDYDINYTPGIK